MIFSENRVPLFRIMLQRATRPAGSPLLLPVLARRGPAGRLVQGILLAGAAGAADRRETLFEGGEAAIAPAAHAAAAIDRAPRIILRLRARAKRGHGAENSQRQKHGSHGRLPGVCGVRSVANAEPARLLHRAVSARPGRGRREFERHAVHAIAQARRFRPVVEDVAEMAAAAMARYRGAGHAERAVGGLVDRFVERRPKTRPAGAAFEFGLRREQRQVAAGAAEGAVAM